MSSHLPSKVWDEIAYPFPNFNGFTIEVSKWMSNFIPHFMMGVITYPCWDLNDVDKKVPRVTVGLPISLRIASLIPEQPYDCLSDNEATPKNMGKNYDWSTTNYEKSQQNKAQ